MTTNQNNHATGIFYDGVGVLIRGPSGAGKSLLALVLLEHSQIFGKDARLIGDDRVMVSREKNQLFMTAFPTIAGKIELRGYGILDRPFANRSPIHIVIDLLDEVVRLPEISELSTELLDQKIPRYPVAKGEIIGLTHQRLIVIEAIHAQKRMHTGVAK